MKPRRSVVGASSGRGRRAEDDGGGERVGTARDHPVAQLAAVRPGRGDRPTAADHALEERLPARGGRALRIGVRLLEGVPDRDREVRRCASCRALRRTPVRKPSSKNCFAPSLPSWRYGLATSSSALGTSIVREELRMDAAQRPAEPHVEEVREVGVADVVVVGRVSEMTTTACSSVDRGICLHRTGRPTRRVVCDCAFTMLPIATSSRYPLDFATEVASAKSQAMGSRLREQVSHSPDSFVRSTRYTTRWQ